MKYPIGTKISTNYFVMGPDEELILTGTIVGVPINDNDDSRYRISWKYSHHPEYDHVKNSLRYNMDRWTKDDSYTFTEPVVELLDEELFNV